MTRCNECGREINEGLSLCSYCKSRIWSIRLNKLAKTTIDVSANVIESVVDTAEKVYEDTSKSLEDYKQQRKMDAIIRKEKEIEKLETELIDSLKDKKNSSQ